MAFAVILLCFSCAAAPNDGNPSLSGTESGSTDNGDADESSLGLFSESYGDFLSMSSPNGAAPLCNDSGMSGLWYANHLHAAFDGSTKLGKTYVEECMYVSDEANQPIFFDLGSIQSVGQMCVWNYGDLSDLDSGVREVQISYSENGSDFTYFGTFTLAKASEDDSREHGGFIASNLEGSGKPIDFGGISARYIVLVPISNWGGSKYGLSEVRVFRHKTALSSGDLIYPESFTPRSDTNAENLTNNTGMSLIAANKDSNETADNDPSHMWYSEYGSDLSMIILNLDGTYPLDSLKIWNYNDPSDLGSGVKNVEIFYTTGEACNIAQSQTENDYINFDAGNWTRLGRYSINKGTGEDALAASLTVDLKGIHAQHIKIRPVNNHNGETSGFGLSEIRVYASSGWAVEPSKLWCGIVSSSGMFKYQGNKSDDPYAAKNQGSGWIGGDGCFSTSLTDNQLNGSVNKDSITLFTFQDSFVGGFGNYRTFDSHQGYAHSTGFSVGMKNMAYMFFKGDIPDVRNVRFYTELDDGLSASHPLQNVLPGSYWISDSTVIDGKVYTMANKFSGLAITSRDFYIQNIGESGTVNMSEVANKAVEGIDGDLPGNMSFEAIFEDGDYIYQYGRRGRGSRLAVRRTTVENYKTFSGWEYYNGSGWVSDPSEAVNISEVNIGNEFNVTYMTSGPFAGKYICVFTQGSIWGTVTCCISDSITGPFVSLNELSDSGSLYFATERYQMSLKSYKDSPNYYVQWNYNAKSQPAISRENELIITYHFGLHDDRVPSWGFFNAVGKEYEQPTFIRLFEIA